MSDTYNVVTHDVERLGAWERAIGTARFSADIPLAGALTLAVLRSGRSHARIVSIDTAPALQLPGVAAVFTAKDIPGRNLFGIINKDQPLLAVDKVRFAGEAVALVAAFTPEAAKAALESIRVEYEDLPTVFDPRAALAEDAPQVHEKGNLLGRRVIARGDAGAALAEAEIVITETYQTSHIEHTYIEPDAGCGYVDPDGVLVIFASTQNTHYDQKDVCELLGLPEERVRVVQAATGGGFGSKLDLTVQGFIGLALYHLRRPVRLVYSREEAYLATSKRHPLTIVMTTGARKDGRLTAMRARIVCDTGAYGSYGLAVMSRSAVHASGPYEIPNVDVECLCVYTNNPVAGAMRGFGVPQLAFAHESQMDLLAGRLGMDPMELRRLNCLKIGSVTCTGQTLEHSVGIGQALEAVKPRYRQALADWKPTAGGPGMRAGVGIGAMWYGIGNTGMQNPSTARVEMDPEGRVTLYTGAADIGQGSTTVLVQITAEVLGLGISDIRPVVADTAYTTNAGATSASRQTYISGNAVKQAVDQLADVLRSEAADLLKIPKADLVLENGTVRSRKDPERSVTLAKLAHRARHRGRPLSWQGYFDPDTTPLDPETGQGSPYATYAFACHVAEVRVDCLTGEVYVDRITAAHDVGRAIHPEGVRGQILGGTAMGLGYALMEEFHPGQTRNMQEYHIPTCGDMPAVEPIIVEDPEPSGPFGAKGVGEPALIPTAPAILNAIADALGTRITHLPANLERVLAAAVRAGCHTPQGG